MYQAKSGVKNISLYWDWVPAPFSLYWGGCPLTKIFFPSLNMYQAKSGVKYFSLYWGGCPSIKIFFPVWTCIKPNLVSKLFPFTGGRGGSLNKNFFFRSEHVSSQIWCQKRFPLLRLSTRPFFPLLGGVSLDKNFFPQSEHVSSQIWCQIFFPLLGGGVSLNKNFFSSLNMY